MASEDNVVNLSVTTGPIRRLVKHFYKRSREQDLAAELHKLKGDYLAVALERDRLRKRVAELEQHAHSAGAGRE